MFTYILHCWHTLSGLVLLGNGLGTGTSKDHQIQQGVSTQSVGTVHRTATRLAGSIKTGHNLIFALLVDGDHLAAVICWYATHVVVHSGQHWDGFAGDIDAGKDHGRLGDARQTLSQLLGRQVMQLQVHMILFGTNAATFHNLNRDGTRDNITRGQILGNWCITFHESFTLGIDKITALTATTLGDEATSAIDTSWMELHKFQILRRQTLTRDQSSTITSACVSRGAGEEGTSIATGGNNRVLGTETMQATILQIDGQNAATLVILEDQIQSKVLHKVVAVVAQRLAIQGVQQRVTRTISDGTTSVRLSTLAELQALTTESALIDLSILGTREGHAVVLQFDDSLGCLTCHIMDGILIAQPITALDRVVHVPLPIILLHVTQCGIDATLGGNCVRSCGEKLRYHCGLETLGDQSKCSTQTRSAGTNNNRIVRMIHNGILLGYSIRIGSLGSLISGCYVITALSRNCCHTLLQNVDISISFNSLELAQLVTRSTLGNAPNAFQNCIFTA